MYKIKVGILYKTESGEQVWTQHYQDWDTDQDMSDFLDDIFQNKFEKWQGNESCKLQPIFTVCLGGFDCEDGKYFCNDCEYYFNEFDAIIGDKCCPYCESSNYRFSIVVTIQDDSGVGCTTTLMYNKGAGVVTECNIFGDGRKSTHEFSIDDFQPEGYGDKGVEFLELIGENPDGH